MPGGCWQTEIRPPGRKENAELSTAPTISITKEEADVMAAAAAAAMLLLLSWYWSRVHQHSPTNPPPSSSSSSAQIKDTSLII